MLYSEPAAMHLGNNENLMLMFVIMHVTQFIVRFSWGHFNFFLTHSENLSVFRGCSDTRKGLKILIRIMINIDRYACISSSSLKNPTGDQARQPLALHITNNKGETPSTECLTDHCVVIRK